jgi:Fungal specific transcription factor domain
MGRDYVGQVRKHAVPLSSDILMLTANSYYQIIHPTFPVLSQSKARVSSKMASYPPALRDALCGALNAALHSFPSGAPLPDQQSSRKAMQLWSTAQLEGVSSRSFATNLAYLQTLLLLAIEATNRAPGTSRGQVAVSQSVWLGSAVGLAYELKLHEYKLPLTDDPDSDERLGRRIWWSLVLMDRWHASSMSTPLLIPDGALVLMPEDQSLLGESLYHLTRKSLYRIIESRTNILGLSIILGHYSILTTTPIEIPSLGLPPFAILGTFLRGELERWREVLPESLSNSPLIHLCYWYLRISVELKQADSDSSSLLSSAIKIVTQLTHNPSLVTPLTYHSTVMATLTLIKLAEYDSTKVEAESGLKGLMENRIAPSAWDSTVRDMINNRKQAGVAALTSSAESKHASTAAQGLQHLAELATANEEGRDVAMGESRNEGESFAANSAGVHHQFHQSLQEIVKNGYLRVLSGESGR